MIRVEQLEKTFQVVQTRGGMLGAVRSLVDRQTRAVRAVDGISFVVQPGEMVACVGPNGAGKSTTIKMLTGILVPSGGHVEVFGLVPHRQRRSLAQRIGVVFGQRTQLWWDLPLSDSFALLRHIYRVPADRFAHNLKTFRDLLELDDFFDTPVRQLSLGQRMRGDLAAALLHDPHVLFLDEPTIGLDVVAKHRIRHFLQALNRERGVTVLLTTHDMTDVERLCSRLLIIDHGRVLYDGNLDQIRARPAEGDGAEPTLEDSVRRVYEYGLEREGARRSGRRGRVGCPRPRGPGAGTSQRRRPGICRWAGQVGRREAGDPGLGLSSVRDRAY